MSKLKEKIKDFMEQTDFLYAEWDGGELTFFDCDYQPWSHGEFIPGTHTREEFAALEKLCKHKDPFKVDSVNQKEHKMKTKSTIKPVPAYLITRLHFLQDEIEHIESEQLEHRKTILELKERLALLKEWEKELKPRLCTRCNGYGKELEWLAQDESQLVTCKQCNGTGCPKVSKGVKNENRGK